MSPEKNKKFVKDQPLDYDLLNSQESNTYGILILVARLKLSILLDFRKILQ